MSFPFVTPKTLVILLWAGILSSSAGGETAPGAPTPNPGVPWPAMDGLNRRAPINPTVGSVKSDRFVGIFYFLWHNNQGGKSPYRDGPYDIAHILKRDPDALSKPDSPLWGPIGQYHYWGEPLYGYYLSADPWVLRRHGQLLADAGVDTLIFDTTNAVTYPKVYRTLCDVFSQMRRQGERVPQITFMVNTRAGETARTIYEDLYQPGLYRELWFHWQGRPLMICDPEQADAELKDFFTLRRAHWPFTMENTDRAWHWEATWPQPYGYVEDPKQPEQVNVSVAQNLRWDTGAVTNMSSGHARGRGFHAGRQDASPSAIDRGLNCQEQWERALELDPPFVMVTGWNEWIAGRWERPGEPIAFVDQYDREHSRDIEPMRGGHGDNFYWQLVANVRRYKGAPPLPRGASRQTIRFEQGFEQWERVEPTFTDHIGETAPRNHDGAGGQHYVNQTGRNDLKAFKVAHDQANLWFFAQTSDPLTSCLDANWMWLLIDIDQDPTTGWEGFDYIVNRQIEKEGQSWIEKNVGGWQWESVAPASFTVAGDKMHVALKRKDLGLTDTTPLRFDFKWVDNVSQPGDVMDFYLSGDVGPEGRFKYRFEGPDPAP